MIQVSIIGTGNVARHLFDTILGHNQLKLVQVIGRNKEALSYFEKEVDTQFDFETMATADIYIIAISDDHILTVSEQLKNCHGLVVHTSGSIPLSKLQSHTNSGVLYPLQTFSKERKVNFKEIPICIEVTHKKDYLLLHEFASILSDQVLEVSSEQRKHLHLAAVFVNNFTNHLYQIGFDICKKQQIAPHLLQPLLLETAKKIENLFPYQAQTGPAIRKDQQTMETHLKLLDNPNYKEIYALLSNSIKETHG